MAVQRTEGKDEQNDRNVYKKFNVKYLLYLYKTIEFEFYKFKKKDALQVFFISLQ